MKNVFIVGSKGIPANYGGFETFVEYLTKNKVSDEIKYHVACLANQKEEFEYNDARCFKVEVPNIGPAKAVYYDIAALKEVYAYVVENNIEDAIVYILACRIGPFLKKYVKLFHEKNIKVFVNPDGHEFKRAKWNWFIRKYWKLSERLMIKNADYVICDSQNIESYIQEDYKKYKPKTTYIAYGADIVDNSDEGKFTNWAKEHNVQKNEYYLIVGRFVPENNYETMIKEFMSSNTKKDLVIVTDYQNNKLYHILDNKYHFTNDKRIKFVGTIYDDSLLKSVRMNAFAYLHGHEVGGTNPSLLEALGSTKLNLLLNVGFNQEVGIDTCIYWGKEKGNLKKLIEHVETFDQDYIDTLGKEAKNRILEAYSWKLIVRKYEDFFLRKDL
ncbi:MAG: DUF1972 domain-containing protein [Bacillota bacterium]|nr:DUF1972 domain-containing protein [Bacillota bacterium]